MSFRNRLYTFGGVQVRGQVNFIGKSNRVLFYSIQEYSLRLMKRTFSCTVCCVDHSEKIELNSG